jgi:hypothetical protein
MAVKITRWLFLELLLGTHKLSTAFRPEHFSGRAGSGRAEKNSVISGQKNPAHDHPTGCVGPQFPGQALAGPGLGWASRVFYSVKQLKTAFRVGLGPKKITGFKISAHDRPVRFVGGPSAGRARAGPKMLRYTDVKKCQHLPTKPTIPFKTITLTH